MRAEQELQVLREVQQTAQKREDELEVTREAMVKQLAQIEQGEGLKREVSSNERSLLCTLVVLL
jgi:hypothetical protein